MNRVSVLMPVFNSAPYLQEALTSIVVQSFTDFELIILNDGSTDGSSDILRRFAANERRTRLIERSNEGLIATRNQLLNEARGEFIAWMDSDDICDSARLKRQVESLDADASLVCIGTNVRLVDPKGSPLGSAYYPLEDRDIRRAQRKGGGFHFPSTMVRRGPVLAVGGFREPFRIGEDLDYLLRIAEKGSLSNLADELYTYRQHLSSTCTTLGARWPRYRTIILELAAQRQNEGTDKLQRGESILVPEERVEDARAYIPAVLLLWADQAMKFADRRRALLYVLKALRVAPFQLSVWRKFASLLLTR